MKILLSQYRPAIRLYKWAETLTNMGYKVTICKTQDEVKNIDWSGFEMRDFRDLNIHRFDRYISFNANVARLSSPGHRHEIQAVGDLKSSLRNRPNAESKSFKDAKAVVFVSEKQMNNAIELYPVLDGKSFVLVNGMTKNLLPVRRKKKVRNGQINLVWHGTLSSDPLNHRYLYRLFEELCKVDAFQLHIYHSALTLPDIYNGLPIELHETVKPECLVRELSQYDAGLIWWNGRRGVADMSLPNKLFEYLAAGLPVIAERYDSLMWFDVKNRGLYFVDDLKTLQEYQVINVMRRHKKTDDWKLFNYENQIDVINKILR